MDYDRRTVLNLIGGAVAAAPFLSAAAAAAPLAPIALPQPRATGGVSVMEALRRRASGRAYADRALSPQHLGEVLWSAFGVNRPDDYRTAPSWRGVRSIDLYAVLKEGVYLYDPEAHRLDPYRAGDFRAQTGTQEFSAQAPLNLLLVADLSRMGSASDQDKRVNAAADAGCIAENVYLYCASEGLATVMRGSVNRAALHKALELKAEQHISYAQSVGYPA